MLPWFKPLGSSALASKHAGVIGRVFV